MKAWWTEHRARFATYPRCFMGAPIAETSCRHVLREGLQRQRCLAALYAQLNPESVLFNTSAPGVRQIAALDR
jgi:hypothetical protein